MTMWVCYLVPGLRGPRKVKVVAKTCSQEMRSGLVIPPEFDSRASEPYGNRNGFELLRQLTKEFSLRNRAEALSLFFFLLLAARVRSSCEEGPGQSALQSA